MKNSKPISKIAIALIAMACLSSAVARGADTDQAAQEKTQLAILQSDAASAEKALACKKLAVYGSEAAVPELAKLLPNPQLSSWARIALEVIPGKAADNALRQAGQTLDGRLLIGVLNSIGVRRDAQAVELLAKKLKDSDNEVASAAAVALGQIGNSAAQTSLHNSLASAPEQVRNAVAEGFVLIAERLHAQGDSAEAIKVYDEIRKANVSKQRVIEATRGAILARKEDGIPLLLEAFQSTDQKMFRLALGVVREFPGNKVDGALASQLRQATPQRAALLVQAMADRSESVDLAAVLEAAKQGDKHVRLSAIDALQRVGDVSCLPALIQIGVDSDAELAQAAKTTLAVLPDEKAAAKIVELLPDANGKSRLLLIELVGMRRIDAVSELVAGLDHSEQAVRAATLTSLGETVPLDKLTLLISRVVDPKRPEDVAVATSALRAASVRMPNQEACALQLTEALQRSPAATKSALLEIISEVGGSTALRSLASSAKGANAELQDTASRLLGKWNGVDAAPVLLDLAKTAPEKKYQIRALRGYIGLARKFAMPERQRADMCAKAIAASQRVEERKLVLEVLQLHPSAPGLRLALAAKKRPDVQAESAAAIRVISQKLRRRGVNVEKILANP